MVDHSAADLRTVIVLSQSSGQPDVMTARLAEPDRGDSIAIIPIAPSIRWDAFQPETAVLTAVGAALFEALAQDALIGTRLAEVLAKTPSGTHRLEFRLNGGEAPVMIETLRAGLEGSPFVLSEDFELLRTVRISGPIDTAVVIDGPLRWTGVLAPSGDAGMVGEIEAELKSALEPLLEQKLQVRPRVLVATASIRKRVEAALVGLGFVDFCVELLGTDEGTIKGQILGPIGESPHIVHFYCHGSLGDENSAPVLLVANKLSAYALPGGERPDDTTLQPAAIFAGDFRNRDLLLVVLNACDSGTAPDAVEDGRPIGSIAFTMVERGNVPFVIAHNKPLLATEAHDSGKSIYRRLALNLRDRDGTNTHTFLPRLMDGRKAMAKERWVVPALWGRDAPTLVEPSADDYALRVKLQALESVQEVLQPTAGSAEIAALHREISTARAELEATSSRVLDSVAAPAALPERVADRLVDDQSESWLDRTILPRGFSGRFKRLTQRALPARSGPPSESVTPTSSGEAHLEDLVDQLLEKYGDQAKTAAVGAAAATVDEADEADEVDEVNEVNEVEERRPAIAGEGVEVE